MEGDICFTKRMYLCFFVAIFIVFLDSFASPCQASPHFVELAWSSIFGNGFIQESTAKMYIVTHFVKSY